MMIQDKEPPGAGTFHQVLFKENSSLPITTCVPRTKLTTHLYENGVSHLLPRLTLKVHSEIEECFDLWDKFSPKESLFDLWDFRYAWHQGYGGRAYFYTIYEQKKPLAILPLWYDPKEKRFEWFGTEWMEDNKITVEDTHFVELLLAVMPQPLRLNSIETLANIEVLKKIVTVKKDDPKNEKKIKGATSIADVLATYTKKHRYNLKADHRKIEALGVRTQINTVPQDQDLEELIELNKKRFDGVKKEKSAFYEEGEVEAFRNIIKNAGQYQVKFIKVYINNELIATDLIAVYNKRYYTLRGGSNVEKHKGIGNFMTYIDFVDAIKENCDIVDCLQEDNGWKHRYFAPRQVFLLTK